MARDTVPWSFRRGQAVNAGEEMRRLAVSAFPALLVVVGFVLGQALIYRHSAPFAWLFVLSVWQFRRRWFLYAVLGGMVGTVLASSWLGGLAFLALAVAIPLPHRLPGWSWLLWPLVGFGGALMFWTGAPSLSPWALIWASLAGAGSVVLYAGLLRQWSQVERGTSDRTTFVLLLTALAAAIAGLAGFHTAWFNLSFVSGAMLVLVAAVAGGAPLGALAGAMLGLTLVLRGEVGGASVGLLVAGGFAAGGMGRHHWRWSGLGLLLGVVGYAVLVLPWVVFHQVGPSLLAAAIVWQMVPPGWVGQLSRLATNLMAGYEETSLPDQMGRVARVMAEMAQAFHVDDAEPSPESQVSEMVVDAVCRRCSLYRTCWEDNFYRSYRGMLDLMALAEHRRVGIEDVAGDLARRCIRREQLAEAVNAAKDKEREHAGYRQRVRESRALAEVQLRGVAEIMSAMALDWHGQPFQYRKARVVLDYRAAVAQRPRAGGSVSGDTALIKDLANFRALVGLSDGMGVGAKAAWESGTAMALIGQLLEAGFSSRLAVHAVNTTLLLRSVEDQFATLDLLVLDRQSGGAEMIKVAATPSFLRRRGQVEIVRGQSPPVGIIDEVGVEPSYHLLEPDDVIVMVTDGVLEEQGPNGDHRLAEILARLPVTDASWLAESILSYMLDSTQEGHDDAAVLVVKLMAHRAVREIRETLGNLTFSEWTRVTPRKESVAVPGDSGGRQRR